MSWAIQVWDDEERLWLSAKDAARHPTEREALVRCGELLAETEQHWHWTQYGYRSGP
jgi:hypothetical protein